jgi:hypothetical protein
MDLRIDVREAQLHETARSLTFAFSLMVRVQMVETVVLLDFTDIFIIIFAHLNQLVK